MLAQPPLPLRQQSPNQASEEWGPCLDCLLSQSVVCNLDAYTRSLHFAGFAPMLASEVQYQ